MERNEIVKYSGGELERISNSIAISNKLIKIHNKKLAQDYLLIADEFQYKKKEYVKASEYYLKSIAIEPAYLEALNNYAKNLLFNLKDYKQAIVYFTKVIDLNPSFENALFQRGLCKGHLGDYLGQIEDISKVMQFDTDISLYTSRAIIKSKINDFQGVIDDCSQAILFNHNDKWSYNFRGKARIGLTDYTNALEDFKQALRIDPNYEYALKNMAEINKIISDRKL